MDAGTDAGLLLLRVSLGLLMIGHGTQKLFGWFGGFGIAGYTDYFTSRGYPAGKLFAYVAGLTMVGAGTLLTLGLLTPLAAAAMVGTMLNVAVAGHERTLWNLHHGYEFPLMLGIIGATLGFTGSGAIALDAVLGLPSGGPGWGAAAVAVGLVTGAATLSLRRPVGQPAHA